MSVQSFLWFLLTLAMTVDAGIIDDNRHLPRQARAVASKGTCTFEYKAVSGDTCGSIITTWGITRQNFLTYNPSLKLDCSGLKIGSVYCLEENFGFSPPSLSTSSTSLSFKSTVTPTGPKPTQAGLTSRCTETATVHLELKLNEDIGTTYYKVLAGDSCNKIVSKYQTFSLSDL